MSHETAKVRRALPTNMAQSSPAVNGRLLLHETLPDASFSIDDGRRFKFKTEDLYRSQQENGNAIARNSNTNTNARVDAHYIRLKVLRARASKKQQLQLRPLREKIV